MISIILIVRLRLTEPLLIRTVKLKRMNIFFNHLICVSCFHLTLICSNLSFILTVKDFFVIFSQKTNYLVDQYGFVYKKKAKTSEGVNTFWRHCTMKCKNKWKGLLWPLLYSSVWFSPILLFITSEENSPRSWKTNVAGFFVPVISSQLILISSLSRFNHGCHTVTHEATMHVSLHF